LPKVDLVLTDPPYGLNKKMNGGTWGITFTNSDMSKWDYLIDKEVMSEVINKAEFSIVWGGHNYMLPASRGWLVWYKPDANGTIGKADLAWTNKDMPIQHISYSIAATNPERNGHPTIKPLVVIKWSASFFPNADTILDPFMGSGTTLVAAKQLGRKAIGIEIEEKYCSIAASRLSQEVISFEFD